jgi:hypothetical protein
MSKNERLKAMAAREQGRTNRTSAREPKHGPYAKKNKQKVELLLSLLAEGHSVEAASVGANIPRRTIYDWIEAHEQFADELQDARHAAEGHLLKSLLSVAARKDDAQTYRWLLSKRRPDIYGDRQELQVSSKVENGVPEVLAMLEQTNHLVNERAGSDSDDEA